MQEGLLTIEMKKSLEKIIKHCFYCNRISDRIVSLLSVKFVMPITANIIHPNILTIMPYLSMLIFVLCETNTYNSIPAKYNTAPNK